MEFNYESKRRKKKKVFMPAGEKGSGPSSWTLAPGGLVVRARKGGPPLGELCLIPQTWYPQPRIPSPAKPIVGDVSQLTFCLCFLYLRGRSVFSKPVGSMHHKQQCTAGMRYGLSPCDKCASSVVQRFSDTLPWAIILLLLLPSLSHTLSIRLWSSLLNIVTITYPGQWCLKLNHGSGEQ